MKRSVVLVLALLLVLAGFGGGVVALVTGDGSEPGGDAGDIYSQEIDWEPCSDQGKLECGTVTVPVDYADPGGDTIEIAVNRLPASGDSLGPLLVNPGGPGAPGTDLPENADGYFRTQLLERYDVVGFDPRGTGDSSPVDCLGDAQLTEWLAADPDPDSKAELRRLTRMQRGFWQGCRENTGEVLGHVSTIEAARDMDVIRAALGDPALDYFGFSYGTRLGATYAELFPERVGRFVLDGGIDVALDAKDDALSQAEGFETALRAYAQHCLDGGDCFLGDSMDAALQTVKGLLADIERQPLPAGSGRTLRIGDALAGMFLPLYQSEYWNFLDDGLTEALNGDGTTLQFLADAYLQRENGEYANNLFEAISVINCLDDPWFVPPGKVKQHLDDFHEVAPTFGRIFAWGLVGCRGIPVKSEEKPLDVRAEGADPILVVGTTRDPATPYQEAVALAKRLESGVLLSRDGDGHLAYNKNNACIDDTVEAYLIEGDVPDNGKEC